MNDVLWLRIQLIAFLLNFSHAFQKIPALPDKHIPLLLHGSKPYSNFLICNLLNHNFRTLQMLPQHHFQLQQSLESIYMCWEVIFANYPSPGPQFLLELRHRFFQIENPHSFIINSHYLKIIKLFLEISRLAA